MSNRICLTLLTGIALAVGTVPAAPVPKVQKQPTDQEVRAKVFGTTWEETDNFVAGKKFPNHRFEPFGWMFSAEGVELWELGGERSTSTYSGVKINVSVEPWRLDIFNKENGKLSVLPTIFKFEGESSTDRERVEGLYPRRKAFSLGARV